MKIGLYSSSVECVTYTIAYSIVLGGYELYLITSSGINSENNNNQHLIYLKKIENLDGVSIIDINNRDFQIELDILYIEFSQNYSRKDVLLWSKKAKLISAICYFQNDFKSQIKQVIKYFPISLKFQNIGFLNGIPEFDLYGLLTNRYLLGFDVHSKFLEDKSLSEQMFSFDWNPGIKRKYKLNFLGNILPIERTQSLQQIKEYFNFFVEPNQGIEHIKYLNIECLWLEYDDSTPLAKRGISAIEYIDTLSNSDFTLSPLGYIKVTHRVVEALVRGSIPVIDRSELQLYDMSLEDGVNCIAVDGRNWISAIERILGFTDSDLIQIRQNIWEMKDKYLLYNVYAKRLRNKMGLD